MHKKQITVPFISASNQEIINSNSYLYLKRRFRPDVHNELTKIFDYIKNQLKLDILNFYKEEKSQTTFSLKADLFLMFKLFELTDDLRSILNKKTFMATILEFHKKYFPTQNIENICTRWASVVNWPFKIFEILFTEIKINGISDEITMEKLTNCTDLNICVIEYNKMSLRPAIEYALKFRPIIWKNQAQRFRMCKENKEKNKQYCEKIDKVEQNEDEAINSKETLKTNKKIDRRRKTRRDDRTNLKETNKKVGYKNKSVYSCKRLEHYNKDQNEVSNNKVVFSNEYDIWPSRNIINQKTLIPIYDNSLQNQLNESFFQFDMYKINAFLSPEAVKLREIKNKLEKFSDFGLLIHEKYGLSMSKVLELIESTNGIPEKIIDYLNTGNDIELWTSEDDDILKIAKSLNDYSLRLLIKYKGIENVKQRIQYKQIPVNFEIIS